MGDGRIDRLAARANMAKLMFIAPMPGTVFVSRIIMRDKGLFQFVLQTQLDLLYLWALTLCHDLKPWMTLQG